MKTPYLISSLLTAGFGSSGQNAEGLSYLEREAAQSWSDGIAILAEQSLSFTLAGHRSHASHRSHGSHRSHRSSSGGGTYVPATPSTPAPSRVITPSDNRNKNSVPPSSVLPRTPSNDASVTTTPTLPSLKGNTKAFVKLTRKVQLFLYALGYYTGALDGIVGTDTKIAITKYQKDNGLSITGVINDELVRSLGITAP